MDSNDLHRDLYYIIHKNQCYKNQDLVYNLELNISQFLYVFIFIISINGRNFFI